MHGSLSTAAGTAPRRFLLLAEEAPDARGRRPRVRRYRLASLGSRGALKAGRPMPRTGHPTELDERI